MWRYTSERELSISNGAMSVPVDAANADYAAIIASGVEIAPYEPDIAALRASAAASIVTAVSAARTRYAGDAALQAGIYDIKAQEADAYVALGRPADTSAFPVLTASATANGRTVSAQADAVRARRDAWLQIAAQTEGLREAGLNAVRNATTAEDIETARAAYVEQLAAV